MLAIRRESLPEWVADANVTARRGAPVRSVDSATSCTDSVPIGDVTRAERAIDAATTATESFAYSPEGLVTSHTPPRGAATTTAYDPAFPWFAVSQSRTVASATGPITLTTQTRWLGVNKLSLTHFGLVGEEVDPNGDVTGHTYDGFLRPLTLVRPGDSAGAPTERWTYHDWNGDPADRRTVVHARRFDPALEVATTTIYDGFGQLERVVEPPPDNLAGCTGSCADVTQEMSYDADGRIVESRHPYFTNTTDAAHLTRTTYDLDAAYSSWRIETAFDLGTLGLLRSPPIAKDNLDFAIEDYVDTWQDYSEGQCTQP